MLYKNASYNSYNDGSDYTDFECLFTETEIGLLNLCDNQIYTYGTKNNGRVSTRLGKSHYERIISFKEKFIEYPKDRISIPKAIKLLRK